MSLRKMCQPILTTSETIAYETGASAEMLNPLEGLGDEELAAGEDYFSVMESNLEKLKAALE